MSANPGRSEGALERRLRELERTVHAAMSESGATPAGRAVERHLERLERRVELVERALDELEQWRAEVRGALTLVRVLVGASILNAGVAAILALDALRGAGG